MICFRPLVPSMDVSAEFDKSVEGETVFDGDGLDFLGWTSAMRHSANKEASSSAAAFDRSLFW